MSMMQFLINLWSRAVAYLRLTPNCIQCQSFIRMHMYAHTDKEVHSHPRKIVFCQSRLILLYHLTIFFLLLVPLSSMVPPFSPIYKQIVFMCVYVYSVYTHKYIHFHTICLSCHQDMLKKKKRTCWELLKLCNKEWRQFWRKKGVLVRCSDGQWVCMTTKKMSYNLSLCWHSCSMIDISYSGTAQTSEDSGGKRFWIASVNLQYVNLMSNSRLAGKIRKLKWPQKNFIIWLAKPATQWSK